jgi:hypothetical protein
MIFNAARDRSIHRPLTPEKDSPVAQLGSVSVCLHAQ